MFGLSVVKAFTVATRTGTVFPITKHNASSFIARLLTILHSRWTMHFAVTSTAFLGATLYTCRTGHFASTDVAFLNALVCIALHVATSTDAILIAFL